MTKKKTTMTKTEPKKKLATIRHDQKRTNIPTVELRDFVSEAVQRPTNVLYPWAAQSTIRTPARTLR